MDDSHQDPMDGYQDEQHPEDLEGASLFEDAPAASGMEEEWPSEDDGSEWLGENSPAAEVPTVDPADCVTLEDLEQELATTVRYASWLAKQRQQLDDEAREIELRLTTATTTAERQRLEARAVSNNAEYNDLLDEQSALPERQEDIKRRITVLKDDAKLDEPRCGRRVRGDDGRFIPSVGIPIVDRPRLAVPTKKKQASSKKKSSEGPSGAIGRQLDARQRFLILDLWQKSDLPATDFAGLCGVSAAALHKWRHLYSKEGLEGLSSHRGPKQGSRLDELTKRAILSMKQEHPTWGVDRIHDSLRRVEGFSASSAAISRLLKENGYEPVYLPTRPHPDKPRRFERGSANEMWQTDLFTFVLKRQNRRVYLVVFMDDHSRFIVGFGLHCSPTTSFVLEVLKQAISSYGAPKDILTDNGPQYKTWRGKSEFTKYCDSIGVGQIVARPRHPETLGKNERFWKTAWDELIRSAVFLNFADAQVRIGHFIDHYNFHRPHQGINGLVPADRYFSAAPEVHRTLNERVAKNAVELAKHGTPRKTVYLTGRVGDETVSLHGEGSQVVLVRDGQPREEVDLTAPGRRADLGAPTKMPEPVSTQVVSTQDGWPPLAPHPTLPVTPTNTVMQEPDAVQAPGQSPLDKGLSMLQAALEEGEDETEEG